MRAWPAACLVLLLAGCAEEAAPVLPAPEPAAPPVGATAEESESFTADWLAWASTCAGGGAGAFAGSTGSADLSPPENLTSLRVDASWTPVNPTATHLRIVLLDGDTVVASAEGESPLSLELAPESAAEMEGGLDVVAWPAECPVAPANAASFSGQEILVEATYGYLAIPPAAAATASPG